jgi:hypothetical protein
MAESTSLEEDAVIDKPRTFRRLCAFRGLLSFCKSQCTFGVYSESRWDCVLCNSPMFCGVVCAASWRVLVQSGDAITCECAQ